MEKKSFHPRIRRFYETYCGRHEPPKSDSTNRGIGSNIKDRRAARLRAVARELRKIGYIVIINHRGTGLVVIEREERFQKRSCEWHGDL